MPVCTVCGEKDFEEHDGHYFCSLCNTQSQEVRVIVADEENFQNFSRTGQIREAATPRKKKKPVDEGDQGRPWSVYEAYQIIIRHQVDALIKIGADKSLKDVVFQIWVNYLSKLGVAFSNDRDTKVKYERQRELFRSTTDKPKIKNVFMIRSLKKTRGMSATKVRKQMEKDQTVVALQDEEFYEGDNPLEDDGDTERGSRGDNSDSSDAEDEDKDEEKWGRYRKSLKYNAVEKVRMTSTISVCYLGLMYTNPLTTVTDLIRWIRQRKIPYLDVRSILPEDMKFCINDWKLFGFGAPPTVKQISQTAGTLASFLNLQRFPDFPMEELINKYIIQLDLPVEFHDYTINLMKYMPINLKYVPSSRKKYTIFWEGVSMSYIVILLKLMFGLTDSHEMLMSEYTKELMEIADYGQPLFVWTDWVQHMKNKMQLQRLKDQMCADKDYIASGKLSDRIKSMRYMCKIKLYSKTYKESIAQPISELSQRWQLRNSENNQSVTGIGDHALHRNRQNDVSLDFDINTLDQEDPLLQLNDSLENNMSTMSSGRLSGINQDCGIEKDISTRSAHFRKSTVQHILKPDTYLAVLRNRLDGHSSNQGLSENDAILSELLSSELYDNPLSRAKRPRMENSRKSISKRHSVSLSNSIVDETSELQSQLERFNGVIEKLKELQGNMMTTLDYETPNFCLSYDWLLKICSNCIECEIEELEQTILKMEIMYFCDQDDASLSRLGKYHYNKLRDVYMGGLHFTKKLTGLKVKKRK